MIVNHCNQNTKDWTIAYKTKHKPILIITCYCKEKFQTNKANIQTKILMYFILTIKHFGWYDVNKVYLKLPLDIYLVCINFFPAMRYYYSDWFLLFLITKSSIIVVWMGSIYVSVSVPLLLFLYQAHTLQRVEWTSIKVFFSTLQLNAFLCL